ncbi:CDP-alcohol phosphatidyltransferase family protein [Actinokineospora sp. NPDC004072]
MAEDRMDPVRGWERLHGVNVSGNRLAVGWIRLVHVLARPVLPVAPDALSAAGVAAAACAVAVAALGWTWAALALVLVSGLLDGIDGAVALRTGRARPLGAVVDAVADRLADLCLIAVLVVLGGDARLAVVVAAAVLLHEYARARAQGAGMGSAGAITVAERPTRVILVAVTCLGTGVAPAGAPGTGWAWPMVTLWLWVGIAVVGGAQLVAGIRRELGRADQAGDDRGGQGDQG